MLFSRLKVLAMPLVCFAAMGSLTSPLLAQQVSGSIGGMVADPSGSAVPNANVKLTDPDSNAERQLQSNAQGEFLFTAVPPGAYTVDISASGFKIAGIDKYRG